LRNISLPILAHRIIDYFFSPFHANIDVDIGIGEALGVNKSLKEKRESQRLNISHFD